MKIKGLALLALAAMLPALRPFAAEAESVRLVTQKRQLFTYVWCHADGGHHFCPTCGTAMLRSGYRDRISVNARCLEGADIFELEVGRYDGRNLMPRGPTL